MIRRPRPRERRRRGQAEKMVEEEGRVQRGPIHRVERDTGGPDSNPCAIFFRASYGDRSCVNRGSIICKRIGRYQENALVEAIERINSN